MPLKLPQVGRVREFPTRTEGVERRSVTIHWPQGSSTRVMAGAPWLAAAREAGMTIPTGCLGGSCGACEIEVNGRVVRACIATVPASRTGQLQVQLGCDPYW